MHACRDLITAGVVNTDCKKHGRKKRAETGVSFNVAAGFP